MHIVPVLSLWFASPALAADAGFVQAADGYLRATLSNPALSYGLTAADPVARAQLRATVGGRVTNAVMDEPLFTAHITTPVASPLVGRSWTTIVEREDGSTLGTLTTTAYEDGVVDVWEDPGLPGGGCVEACPSLVHAVGGAYRPTPDGGHVVVADITADEPIGAIYQEETIWTPTWICDLFGDDGACLEGHEEQLPETVVSDVSALLACHHATPLPPLGRNTQISLVTFDAAGATLGTSTVPVRTPWLDGLGGANAVPLVGDANTEVVLADGAFGPSLEPATALLVSSAAWSRRGALPASARVTWVHGDTWELPLASLQASGEVVFPTTPYLELGLTVQVTFPPPRAPLGLVPPPTTLILDASGEACLGLVCGTVMGAADGLHLHLTATSDHPSSLPPGARVVVQDAMGTTLAAGVNLMFGDDITATYGTTLSFAEDPWGAPLAAQITQYGPTGARLRTGRLYAVAGVDPDGQLGLGYPTSDTTIQARGDILIGGEPVDIERTAPETGAPITCPAATRVVRKAGPRFTAIRNATMCSE